MSVKFFDNPVYSPDNRNEHCFGISVNDNDEIESVIISSHDYREFALAGMPRLKQLVDCTFFPACLKFDERGNLLCDEVEDIRNLPTWRNLGTESMMLHSVLMRRNEVRCGGAHYVLLAVAPNDVVLFDAVDFAIVSASRDYIFRELIQDPDCIANARVSRNADGSIHDIVPVNKSAVRYVERIPWTIEFTVKGDVTVPLSLFEKENNGRTDLEVHITLSKCLSFGDLRKQASYYDVKYNSTDVKAIAYISDSITIEQLDTIEEMENFVKSYVTSLNMGQLHFQSVDVRNLYVNLAARTI